MGTITVTFKYKRTWHEESLTEEDPPIEICAFSDAGGTSKQTVQYSRIKKDDNRFTVSFLGARNLLVQPADTLPKSELDAMWVGSLAVEAQSKHQARLEKDNELAMKDENSNDFDPLKYAIEFFSSYNSDTNQFSIK